MKRSIFTLLSVALILGGCATMSPDECRTADWYLLGEMDARSGRTAAHFASRDRACREAGFPADQQSWREGWEHGLTVFCTAPQGFRFGRDGGRYEPICPGALEPDFLSGYDIGRQMYVLGDRIESLRSEIQLVDVSLREAAGNGSLTDEELAALQRRQELLSRQARENELRLAELSGLARGLGLH